MNSASTRPDRDVVLFLGAGFSQSAGLPVMRDFGAHSKRERELLIQRHGLLDPTERQFRFAASMVIDAGTTFEAFKDFCVRSGTRSKDEWENLETVFCVAEALDEAGAPDIQLRLPAPLETREGSIVQLYSTKTILHDIQLWIWKVYQRMPLIQKIPKMEARREGYRRFFETVRDCDLQGRTTVVTTNYDIAFEFLAWKHGLECAYPIEWTNDVEVSQTPDGYITGHRASSDAIILCKLHGSVNYFEDEDTPETLRIRVARDVGGGATVGNSGGVLGRPALLGLDAIWALQKRYGPSLTPAIVPPTYAKLGRRAWLKLIWEEARRAIAEARSIVFVGYSFPPSDGFMSALLSGAAAMRKGVDQPRIVIVDPSEESHARIRGLFSGADVRWIRSKFLEATERELPEVMADL